MNPAFTQVMGTLLVLAALLHGFRGLFALLPSQKKVPASEVDKWCRDHGAKIEWSDPPGGVWLEWGSGAQRRGFWSYDIEEAYRKAIEFSQAMDSRIPHKEKE